MLFNRKEYMKQWKEKNSKHLKEYKKKWRERNPEKIKEYNKKYNKKYGKLYYQNHKEEAKKSRDKWRKKNPEKVKKGKRQYYKNHLKKIEQYRKDHREKHKEYKKNHLKLKVQYVQDYKISKGCSICGYNENPKFLGFHHPDDNKEFNVSKAVTNNMGLKKIKKEMDKCILLCGSCHSKLSQKLKREEKKKLDKNKK